MIGGRRFAALVLVLGGWTSTALGQDCAAIERRTNALVLALPAVADEMGAYRELGDAALEGTAVCPASAKLWYWAARSAEVLEGPLAGAAFAAAGGAATIAREAEVHVPGSVGIATVVARLAGTEAAARRALALDASYPPARRALAAALLKEGAPEEASKLMSSAGGTGPDRLTRARILLALGRAKEAAAEARTARDRPEPDPSELTPSFEVLRDANETLGLALRAQGRAVEAGPFLKAAAAAGSQMARAALRAGATPR